jgi:tetratricopeptide (TPR) repeat protein
MAQGNLKFSPEIEQLNQKLQADPKSRVFAQLADAYRKANLLDEAIDTSQKGLKNHPRYAVAHIILGRCYLAKSVYGLARDEFQLAIKDDPQSLVGYKLLAETYEKQQMLPEAIKYYQLVLDLEPTDIALAEKIANLKNIQPIKPETVPVSPPPVVEKEIKSPVEAALVIAPSTVSEPLADQVVLPAESTSSASMVIEKAEEQQKAADKKPTDTYALPELLRSEPVKPIAKADIAEAIKVAETPQKPSIEIQPKKDETNVKESAQLEIESQGPTSTLAEIYVQQGFLEKAIDIYKELIAANPDNQEYKNRMDELLGKAYPEEESDTAEATLPVVKEQKELPTEKIAGTEIVTLANSMPEETPDHQNPFAHMFVALEKTAGIGYLASQPEEANPEVIPPTASVNESKNEPETVKKEPISSVADREESTKSLDFGALFSDVPAVVPAEPAALSKTVSEPEPMPSVITVTENTAPAEEGEETVSSFQAWLSKIQK